MIIDMYIIVLYFILFFGAVRPISAVPVDSKLLKLEGPVRRFDRLINSVVRTVDGNDIIFPSVCPPACEHLHRAETSVTYPIGNPNNCSCTCPSQRPTYISSIGTCVEKLNEDECPYMIKWDLEASTIPIVRLRPHSIILPDSSLNFQGVGIQNGESSCIIKNILYENVQTTMKALAKDSLFQLTSSNGKTILYFGGTEVDVAFLTGSVIVLKLECKKISLTDLTRQACISLRVAGTSGKVSHRHDKKYAVDGTEWRIEIVFLLIVISVVVIVLIMTFIIWNICWGIKKRKLINNFQMQFVQQYRDNQHQVQELNFSDKICGSEQHGIEEPTLPQSLSRKRLIFSTEYFDHGQMTHPSPLAEQFLFDLRRVVNFARERIRQRRFLPTLSIICEEDDEIEKNENIDKNIEEHSAFCTNSSPQYSPQSEDSGRSVDSGRESRENSDEDDEKQIGKLETTTHVAELVKSFEKSVPRPSYVPILLNSSIRKKNIQNMTIVPSSSASKIVNNANSCAAMTGKDNAVRIIPTKVSQNRIQERRRYAVFPSDGTFNKSLPRRVKPTPAATQQLNN